MRRYATEKFVWDGVTVELKPNKYLPRRMTDILIGGKLQGIYPNAKAVRVAKALALVTAAKPK